MKKIKNLKFWHKGLSACHIILRLIFSMIKKESNLEGVFEFLNPDFQLDRNFNPPRNLSEQFLYILKYK